MDSPAPAPPLDALLPAIYQGVQAHLEWNQRLLRCSMLRQSPGDDVLLPDSHRRCYLGAWLERDRNVLEGVDAGLFARILRTHETMHDAVRSMCRRVLDGATAEPADLRSFEETQAALVRLLALLRDKIAAACVRRDPLTGLPLRHGVEEVFVQRQAEARRTGATLHLLMIDIDRFKQVNDTWGHPTGDLALRHLAGLLGAALRKSDYLMRYGGEEMLALVLNADTGGAEATAQRLLEACRQSPLHAGDLVVPLRITIGLARVGASDTLASALARADRALLEGKRAGRDRFVAAPD